MAVSCRAAAVAATDRPHVHGLSMSAWQHPRMIFRPTPLPSEVFTSRFLGRLPPEVAASFTPEQLAALQLAFGMRYAMEHAVDVRRTVTLPWGRFYLVLLGGRDRRCVAPGRALAAVTRTVAGCAAVGLAAALACILLPPL